jgi:hypothetical protein
MAAVYERCEWECDECNNAKAKANAAAFVARSCQAQFAALKAKHERDANKYALLMGKAQQLNEELTLRVKELERYIVAHKANEKKAKQ